MPSNPVAEAAGPSLSGTSLTCWIPWNGDPNDDSAKAHHWSLQGTPSYISGPTSGQAIEFNSAQSEYATIADHPDFDTTGAFSIGAWLKTNDLSVDTGFFQKLAGATGCLIFWEMPAAHWRFRANLTNSTNPSNTSADWIANDTWQHFVFTRANATADVKVYKNAGTPVVLPMAGATVTENTNTADLGRYFGTPGEMDIAEFFHFNRELSASEVAVTYNSGSRLTFADITWT